MLNYIMPSVLSPDSSHDKYVSGPINMVRMEGSIDGVKKIVYLMFDIHMELWEQSKCDDIDSLSIAQYLLNGFKNSNEKDVKYDFMLEHFPNALPLYLNNRSKMYLKEARELFSKLFEYDHKKNTVLGSKKFPNMRFHYLDIRTYLNFNLDFLLFSSPLEYTNSLREIAPQDIDKIIKMVDDHYNVLMFSYDVLYNKIKYDKPTKPLVLDDSSKIREYTLLEFQLIVHHLLNKIRNCKNEKVKKGLNKIIDGELKDKFREISDIHKKFIDYLTKARKVVDFSWNELVEKDGEWNYYFMKNDEKEILAETKKMVHDIWKKAFIVNVLIVDLYLLRRLLDKDYITNSVVYTGAFHSTNYIKILAGQFNFKVTHASYSKYNIDKVNEMIKKGKNLGEIFYPPYLAQCINVGSFPELFE